MRSEYFSITSSSPLLYWNTRGRLCVVKDEKTAKELRIQGWKKCTDSNAKVGIYNPVYDRGDKNQFTNLLPLDQPAPSQSGNILTCIEI